MIANAELPIFARSTSNTTAYAMSNLAIPTATTSRFNNLVGGNNILLQQQLIKGTTMSRRLVKIYVSDPHPSVPLEDCLLYRSDEKLTDATDQELFFELDVHTLLKDHNKKRIHFLDKSVKTAERIVLEPARIRDLKMVVETIADL